jgi:hypothetical protein
MKTKLAGIGPRIVAGIVGALVATMTMAQQQPCDGWGYSTPGCSRHPDPSHPTIYGYCGVNGVAGCYECIYTCYGGTFDYCAERPDGAVRFCQGRTERPDPPWGGSPQPNCPILIDLDGNGYHLVGLENAVQFDINNNAAPDMVSWTRAGERDAFLCLDRNGNGRIDNGGELFGDSTLLASGQRAANGFLALAEFDTTEMGGNGDGRISQTDAVFDRLRLWVDWNHDGASSPGELSTLQSGGVVEISTNYVLTPRQDQYGNRFRYLSLAKLRNAAGLVRAAPIWDVIFRTFVLP